MARLPMGIPRLRPEAGGETPASNQEGAASTLKPCPEVGGALWLEPRWVAARTRNLDPVAMWLTRPRTWAEFVRLAVSRRAGPSEKPAAAGRWRDGS